MQMMNKHRMSAMAGAILAGIPTAIAWGGQMVAPLFPPPFGFIGILLAAGLGAVIGAASGYLASWGWSQLKPKIMRLLKLNMQTESAAVLNLRPIIIIPGPSVDLEQLQRETQLPLYNLSDQPVADTPANTEAVTRASHISPISHQ